MELTPRSSPLDLARSNFAPFSATSPRRQLTPAPRLRSKASRMLTRVAVTGYTADEVSDCLPKLREELRHHSEWSRCDAGWDPLRQALVVVVEEDDHQFGTDHNLVDSVADCVVASCPFAAREIVLEAIAS